MRFTIQRELVVKPLQFVVGVVERRKTVPILANILTEVSDQYLTFTATDLEVQLKASINLNCSVIPGKITIPGRKLFDICRALPEESLITCELDDGRVIISCNQTKFTLLTLPAEEYPNIGEDIGILEFSIKQNELRLLLEKTQFSMANQDVRYFLNGLLLEVGREKISAVSADGHRMSLCAVSAPGISPPELTQVIIPRKGITELYRLLEESDECVDIVITENHIKVTTSSVIFTSKLIDGRFPDYNNVIPRNGDKQIEVDCEQLKQVLTRASILTNEKYKGVCLQLRNGMLNVMANNPEQEEVEDCLMINEYDGADLDIGFNVNYIIDVLNTINCERVRLTFKDTQSSLLIEGCDEVDSVYVVMPMRL